MWLAWHPPSEVTTSFTPATAVSQLLFLICGWYVARSEQKRVRVGGYPLSAVLCMRRTVGVNDRAHVLALKSFGDVRRHQSVDNLDLFLMLRVRHEFQGHRVDGQRVQPAGQQVSGF